MIFQYITGLLVSRKTTHPYYATMTSVAEGLAYVDEHSKYVLKSCRGFVITICLHCLNTHTCIIVYEAGFMSGHDYSYLR